MRRNSRFAHSFLCLGLTLFVFVASIGLFAQTTISTGSIQGTVTDPSGAVVGGARVTIINKATGQNIGTTTSSSGTYASGALIPGNYQIKIEAKGFKTLEMAVTVEVNTTATGNARMTLGEAAETVEVEGSAVSVNTEQATVQGVLTSAANRESPDQRTQLPRPCAAGAGRADSGRRHL